MRGVAGWRVSAGAKDLKEPVMRGTSVSIEKGRLAYSEDRARVSRNSELGNSGSCRRW